MYNKSMRISASEINRFTYCPYQWYYERKFGRKHLTGEKSEVKSPAKKKNPSVKNLSSAKHMAESNFARGRKFHEEYNLNLSSNRWIWKLILCIFGIIVILSVIVGVAYLGVAYLW